MESQKRKYKNGIIKKVLMLLTIFFSITTWLVAQQDFNPPFTIRNDGCYASIDTALENQIGYQCFIFYPNQTFVYVAYMFPKKNQLQLDDFLEAEKLWGHYELDHGIVILSHFSKQPMWAGIIDFPWGKRQLNATCKKNEITMQDVGIVKVKPRESPPKDFRFKYQFMPLSFPLDSVLSSLKR
jgi:hypothetical protein